MKRKFYLFLFTAVACTITFKLNAQISKGTALLGGSISFSSGKSNSYSNEYQNKGSAFYVAPTYGKFIKQNLVVGGDLSYRTSNTTNKSPNSAEQKQKDNYYGLGVLLRQYKNLGSSGFYLFLQSRLGGELSRGKTEYSYGYNNTTTKGYNIQLNLSPGIAYAITPRFHLETGLNNLLFARYNHSKSKANSSTTAYNSKSSDFYAGASVGGGLEWTVGFRILLPK